EVGVRDRTVTGVQTCALPILARLDSIDGAMNRYRLHGANMTFGADGVRLAKNKRAEIRMRRWILANLSASRAPVSALLACHQLQIGRASWRGSVAGVVEREEL